MAKIKNYLGRNLKSDRTADKISIDKRSAVMAKIKSKGTAFELLFFQSLAELNIQFEAHPKDIFGKPDLIIRDKNVCVFLDSDFWHGWQFPRWKHKMKNAFWRDKIDRNRRRDKKVTATLKRNGFVVIRLWEHQLKNDLTRCVSRLNNILNK